MSLLSLAGAWIGGFLVAAGLLWRRRRSSGTEDRDMDGAIVELEDGSVMWIGPRDPRTAGVASTLKNDASGQTISGTWSSYTETSTTRGRDGPHGFRGEDLTDREVDEWLREHGLKGYE